MLTKKQRDLLNYLIAYEKIHQIYPSLREIQAHFSFKSIGSVQGLIQRLEKKSLLSKGKTARCFSIVEDVKKNDLLIGQLENKFSLRLFSKIKTPISLDHHNRFFIQVQDSSFIESGIYPKDLVLITPKTSFTSDCWFLMKIDQTFFIKKVQLEKQFVLFKEEDQSIKFRKEDITLYGQVLQVVRYFESL